MTRAACNDAPHPVRVLVVIGQLEVGGAEQHLVQVLPGLRAAGIDARVFALKPGGALEPQFHARGVPVEAGRGAGAAGHGLLRAVARLVRTLRDMRPDVVHFFLPAAYLVGTLVTTGHRARRVMSRRSLAHYQRRYPGVSLVERLCHRRMDAILANSQAVARELRAEGVRPERLGVIYNGVEDRTQGHTRAATRSALGIPPEALVLVMVANLIPYKGHADLLEALAIAAPSLGNAWVALLAGRDDGIGSALQAQAARLGLAPHLRWLGSVADVGTCLAAADIGILASHQEGFSNAVLEGMAAGLPMIVTDVGGNAEAVVAGESGLVVPARSPAALAAALRCLAAAPGDRTRLGAAARRRARERFTVETCVAQYAALYRNLAAGAAPAIPASAALTGVQ